MKGIEEIGNLEISDLERIADDGRVEVPEGLDRKVLAAIIASSAEKPSPRKGRVLKWIPAAAAAGIAASLAVLLTISDEPKDSFDDPKLAYAELEKAISLVSAKMERGFEMAAEAEPAIEMTENIINGK